ncbi:MAG: undecaprenyl-diphosphatase [Alphaproteobacteria bacterium]|nr:undecaprenyl-diphosphatase [Alphaproteobacteria bacterium]
MPLLHIFLIAVLQGITEFLPISSSGHLVLAHHFLDGSNVPLSYERIFDIAVHVGTLLSVLLCFHKDILRMTTGFFDFCRGQRNNNTRLLGYLLLSSIPAIIVGLGLHILQPSWFQSVELVAWTMFLFAFVLYAADKFFPVNKKVEDMTWKNALLVGFAQAIALIPGVSRSGITMSAARYCGLERVEAARFSLLMATIAISGAGAVGATDLLEANDPVLFAVVGWGILFSFIAGLLTIIGMMFLLKRFTFTPFVIYRLLVGGTLLVLIYTGVMAV